MYQLKGLAIVMFFIGVLGVGSPNRLKLFSLVICGEGFNPGLIALTGEAMLIAVFLMTILPRFGDMMGEAQRPLICMSQSYASSGTAVGSVSFRYIFLLTFFGTSAILIGASSRTVTTPLLGDKGVSA